MNTMLKSALFAAVILFGGIYAFDAVYKNVSATNGDVAMIEPAAGDETESMMDQASEMASDAAHATKEAAEDAYEATTEAVGDAADATSEAASDAADAASEMYDDAAEATEDAIHDGHEMIKDTFDGTETEHEAAPATEDTAPVNEDEKFDVEENIEKQSNNVLEKIDQEAAAMANEADKKIVSETNKAINKAAETEPAAGQ